MRIGNVASLLGKTASIILPGSPPKTPLMGQAEIETASRRGSWMSGLPLFCDDEAKVGLLSRGDETSISIEQEKNDLIRRSSITSLQDDNWITHTDIAKMGNLPYLSGMRALASIAIEIYHLVKPGSRSASYFGCFGLSIHFVQGAFLITGSLLQLQKANQGKPLLQRYTHLPRFFIGRWVRLYPALVLMIIITAIWWQRKYDMALHLSKAIFRTLFKIQHTKIFLISDDHPPNPFAHTWFLDVQEAFYLSWALALPLLVMVGTKPRAIILLALGAFSFRRRLKENLFNAALSINMWKMVAGVTLQLIPIPRVFVQHHAKTLAVFVIALTCLWGSSAYLNDNVSDKMKRVHGDVAGVVATFAVTLAALSKQPTPSPALTDDAASQKTVSPPSRVNQFLSYVISPLGILDAKWLVFVGRVSYSWYLWQIPVMHYETQFMSGYKSIGSTCEAFIIAMISTIFIEEPIRDWYRNRLKRQKMAAMIAKEDTAANTSGQ